MPFPKGPVRLIVAWMMVGGGSELGNAGYPFPKEKRLDVLKQLEELCE